MKKLILTLLAHALYADPSAKLVDLAEKGYNYAKNHNIANDSVMVLVDFSKPSFAKRLWIYDIAKHQVMFSSYVAHGKASGNVDSNKFSNQNKSHKSSIGFFQILNQYMGKHGLSIKLAGLERSNNNALKRGIVIHSANYVTDSFINKYHRAGRSWGCFATSKTTEKNIIKLTHKNSLLFAYYPEKTWLAESAFLGAK